MNVSKVALAISAAFIISGCGSDSNENGKVAPKPTFPPAIESELLSVTVIDGYLEGSTVWLDKKENQNFLPDGDEPRAVTNKQGVAVFNDIAPDSFDKYVLVAKATAGKTIDHDNGKPVAGSFYLTAPLMTSETALLRSSQESKSYSSVITPLTTLVEMKLRQPASSASEASIIAASKQVAEELGLNADNAHIVLSDFKKLSSADATKAEQAAVSLVVSGAMPATVDELSTQFDSVLTHASTVNSRVKDAAADELVIHDADAADGTRVVKKTDSDGDGLIDALDAFPEDDSEWYDTDGDGKGNNADTDDDGDGVDDEKDTFPLESSEDTDTDTDSIGNNEDSDDDNDGVLDIDDAFPYDPTEDSDTDKDDIGNNKDTDDDGDGVDDAHDRFPLNENESVDTDNDGIGNNSDDDDDGDGYADNKDNEPLSKLVIPETFNACLETLPDYPEGTAARPDGSNSLLYTISKLNNGQTERSQSTQTERYVGQRVGLPDGNLAERTIDVTQIVTQTPGAQAGVWNPGFELSYVDADNQQYLGYEDVFRRWWGINLATNAPNDMRLKEKTTSWVDRIDHRSPEAAIRHEKISSVYVGKEIIDTLFGLREACVVQHDSEFKWNDAGKYSVESAKRYLDKNRIVVREEKDNLEYNLNSEGEPESEPNWGYTDSVKVLNGMIHHGVLYGQDPVTSHIPADQPVTMGQCLADLPDANYERKKNDSLLFDMYRSSSKVDANSKEVETTEQYGTYELVPLVDSGISWQGYEGLVESLLKGTFTSGYAFSERYFEYANGMMAGFEGRENGTDNIAWGHKNTLSQQRSVEGSYFMPEVHYHDASLLNSTEQKASFKQVQYVVFAGVEQVVDFALDRAVPACKYYSRLETTFYQADGSPLLDEANNPIKDFIDETVWRDNKGIINRDRKTQKWDYEHWYRKPAVKQ
ncbi:hypothetical protein [Photobacterium chitinilyticum]|uniref:Thrombospondin n=1 Tax=Photobacterium chitinilyticum TaxID=2485123 RepID=A0A444JWW5_9GAMM|nr:hypothetical protein [Photobacterium chitinilyticum]RWX57569.1 hypothetical protein EDI28_06020 [Photobacterium chitinilyticum]